MHTHIHTHWSLGKPACKPPLLANLPPWIDATDLLVRQKQYTEHTHTLIHTYTQSGTLESPPATIPSWINTTDFVVRQKNSIKHTHTRTHINTHTHTYTQRYLGKPTCNHPLLDQHHRPRHRKARTQGNEHHATMGWVVLVGCGNSSVCRSE
jgi:hypothetical protein